MVDEPHTYRDTHTRAHINHSLARSLIHESISRTSNQTTTDTIPGGWMVPKPNPESSVVTYCLPPSILPSRFGNETKLEGNALSFTVHLMPFTPLPPPSIGCRGVDASKQREFRKYWQLINIPSQPVRFLCTPHRVFQSSAPVAKVAFHPLSNGTLSTFAWLE